MPIPNLPSKVYHGTDEQSGISIRQGGLDEAEWRVAGGSAGVDEKGFSVTTDRSIAVIWARFRAVQRGGDAEGLVLEADTSGLPLQQGGTGQWTDPAELFIAPEDFAVVGPGIFQ